MKAYKKIIFVGEDNTALSPMAEAIMKKIVHKSVDIMSRGMVVLFSEPYNPKIIKILRDHGIDIKDEGSKGIKNKDFSEDTLVFVMNDKQKKSLYATFDSAINVYTIKEFVGDGGAVTEPFGKDIEAYEEAFSELCTLLIRVNEKLNELLEEEK